MSVVVYYARLSPEQLERLANSPERARSLILAGGSESHPDFPDLGRLYLDRAYEPVAWLLSPLARAEADHMRRLGENPNEPREAARGRVAAIDAMPIDPAYEALHGSRSYVDDRFAIGLGSPAVFPVAKVRALSAALDEIWRADLERGFDREEMIRDGMRYCDEDDIMDEYILPEFKRLQVFYRAAAANNQVVMVVFT